MESLTLTCQKSEDFTAGILKLQNVLSRNKACELAPFKLYVPQSSLPQLKSEKEFYIASLLGLQVEDQRGHSYGEVLNWYPVGPNIVLVFGQRGQKSSKIYELPFVDQFFPLVSCEKGIIKVSMPEYL